MINLPIAFDFLKCNFWNYYEKIYKFKSNSKPKWPRQEKRITKKQLCIVVVIDYRIYSYLWLREAT